MTSSKNIGLAFGAAAEYAELSARGETARASQLVDDIDNWVGYVMTNAEGKRRMRWPAPVCDAAKLPENARQRPRADDVSFWGRR